MKINFLLSLVKVLLLCVVVFFISSRYVNDAKSVGWAVFGCGLLCFVFLRLSKIKIKNVWPDVVFGLIDNGILAVMAIVGGEVAGVAGAIIGGVVGNAITDGIAGIFEGEIAEKLRERKISEERTMLGSAVGKMAGCLLGAGAVLIIVSLI